MSRVLQLTAAKPSVDKSVSGAHTQSAYVFDTARGSCSPSTLTPDGDPNIEDSVLWRGGTPSIDVCGT